MPQLQAMWAKLNANERLVGYGAIVILIAWLLSIFTSYGIGTSYAFIAAVVVLIIYWLKYGSTTPVTWPLPVPTLVLIVAAIAALSTVVPALGYLGFLFGNLFSVFGIAVLLTVIGTILMLYGAWMEYQASTKAA